MDSHGDDWRRRFPRLFEESYVDYAGARVAYSGGAAPDELLSRLHLVAVTEGAEVVVCRSTRGERFLPGGTREPGESLSNPVDGERVVEVLTLPPQEAADYLGEEDPIHSDVLRHAIALGLLHRSQ